MRSSFGSSGASVSVQALPDRVGSSAWYETRGPPQRWRLSRFIPPPLPSSTTIAVSAVQASSRMRWIRSRRAPVIAARGRVTRSPSAIPACGSRVSSRSSASTRPTARERSPSPDSTTRAAKSRTDPHLPSYRSIVLRLSSESTRPRNLSERSQEIRELADAGLPRDPAARLAVQRRPGELPGLPAGVKALECLADRRRVVRRLVPAGAGLADQVCGCPFGRYRGQDRTLRGDVLEHLSRQDSPAAAAGLRDQQQQSLGVSLHPEPAPARHVRDQLEPVTEVQPFGPLPVGRPEAADEEGADAP